MKVFLILISLIAITASSSLSFENSKDFYLWRQYSQGERLAYLRGVMVTAISFGVLSSDLFGTENYKNGCNESSKLQKIITQKSDEIYDPLCFGAKNLDEYLPFMSNAITHFYSDPSNGMFEIDEIIEISNKKMKGTDVEKTISERRKNIIEAQKSRQEFFKKLEKTK